MAKFKPFTSPIQNLAYLIRPLHYVYGLYQRFNIFDDSPPVELNIHPLKKNRYYLLGGFNPLFAIKKDIVDTFKPYYSRFYVARDFLQPVRGLGNIIKGVFIPLAIVVLVLAIGSGVIRKIRTRNNARPFELSTHIKRNLAMAVGGVLYGISSLIRGASQILATVFLPLRILSRSISTCVNDTSVAERLKSRAKEMEALINNDDKTIDEAVRIDNTRIGFYNKILRGNFRNETIGVDLSECRKAYEDSSNFMTEVDDDDLKKRVPTIVDSSDNRNSTSTFFNLFANYENMSSPLIPIPPGHKALEERQEYLHL